MNDPHVDALIYKVKHDVTVNYDKAEPLEFDTAEFNVKIKDHIARIEMKAHFATGEEARAIVEPFIHSWELRVSLDQAPGEFELVYQSEEIIDRSPPPGVVIVVPPTRFAFVGMDAVLQVGRRYYPAPPSEPFTVSPDVAVMAYRYTMYRQGKDTLSAMAYFCFTVLVESVPKPQGGRKCAAQQFKIAPDVLNQLGELTAEKGGREARKAKGTGVDFTAAERTWIEAAVKAIIGRAAEFAGDPSQPLQQLTMADLPSLSGQSP